MYDAFRDAEFDKIDEAEMTVEKFSKTYLNTPRKFDTLLKFVKESSSIKDKCENIMLDYFIKFFFVPSLVDHVGWVKGSKASRWVKIYIGKDEQFRKFIRKAFDGFEIEGDIIVPIILNSRNKSKREKWEKDHSEFSSINI